MLPRLFVGPHAVAAMEQVALEPVAMAQLLLSAVPLQLDAAGRVVAVHGAPDPPAAAVRRDCRPVSALREPAACGSQQGR